MPLIFLWEVLGGLGLFILGMKSMSDGLQKIAGDRLRLFLERITGNRLTAALMGSCLASLLQSSGAASILVIGLVNAGLISIYQALSVLLGTGLGATLAIQFIAFKISSFALPAVFLGVLFTFFSKNRKVVYLGNLLLGAGLVFLGLKIMEAGFSPISQSDLFKGLNSHFISWRLSAALLGALITILLQSSSAATGLIIVMAGSGVIGYDTSAAMVVGEVIGTSFIAVAATINGSLAAKRTAIIYLLMNSASAGLILMLLPVFLRLVHLVSPGEVDFATANLSIVSFVGEPQTALKPFVARHLANAHTLFNLLNILLFLPLIGVLARSATVILPSKGGALDVEPRAKYIDSRVLNTPTIAFLQAKNELKRMADISILMFSEIVEQLFKFDAKRAVRISCHQEALNVLHREISRFLVLLSKQSINTSNSMEIPSLLRIVNDLKHIGDLNIAILDLLRRKKEDKINFSVSAMSDLKSFASHIRDLFFLASGAIKQDPTDRFAKQQALITDIEKMQDSMLASHMKRLIDGKCSVSAGVFYSDIISAFGKIADHSTTLLEMERELLATTPQSSN